MISLERQKVQHQKSGEAAIHLETLYVEKLAELIKEKRILFSQQAFDEYKTMVALKKMKLQWIHLKDCGSSKY